MSAHFCSFLDCLFYRFPTIPVSYRRTDAALDIALLNRTNSWFRIAHLNRQICVENHVGQSQCPLITGYTRLVGSHTDWPRINASRHPASFKPTRSLQSVMISAQRGCTILQSRVQASNMATCRATKGTRR
ncbi:hypothetical protein CRV24_000253 [Beauveria bassiana]|nr:hypothetical protein CRV24_000253 [Beauveria bassiana]